MGTSRSEFDDLTFSSGVCERSYAEVPGAAIGGVLGSQTGPNVVAGNGNRVRYFQYNDLGTVLIQTKADDSLEGLWLPDFFGNYTYPIAGDLPRASGSPSRPELGLTGKMYDTAAGLYYFNARWYDPERGRFISNAPTDLAQEHPYAFCAGNPLEFVDVDGARPNHWDWYNPFDDISYGFDWVLDRKLDQYIDMAHLVGLSPENWGTHNGDWWKCFATCMSTSQSPINFGAWAAPFSALPKKLLPPFRVVSSKQRLTTILSSIDHFAETGWLRAMGRGLSTLATPLTLAEGGWDLMRLTKCAAQCSGDSCSY